MTTPTLNFNYQYDDRANRWRDTVSGRFVSETGVIDEMRVHQEATYSALDALTRNLYSGSINVQQWQLSVAQELKDAHIAQAIFGAGGRDNMTSTEWGRVGGTLADEYRYLTRFAEDIAAGRVSEAQAMARIKQYGNATQQSYYREQVAQAEPDSVIIWRISAAENCPDCLALAAGSPYRADNLPTYPGAGATRCRGNCKCTLEIVHQTGRRRGR